MREYVEDPSVEPEDLRPVASCICSIACSLYECERAFSMMNTIQTDVRNSLLTETAASGFFLQLKHRDFNQPCYQMNMTVLKCLHLMQCTIFLNSLARRG